MESHRDLSGPEGTLEGRGAREEADSAMPTPAPRQEAADRYSADKPDARLGDTAGPAGADDRLFFRVVVLIFLGALLYVLLLRDGLSPLLVGASIFGLLLLTQKGVRFEVGIGVISTLLIAEWFISEVAGLLWPFVVSFVLAYLLAPLVGVIGRRLSRTLAIGVIVLFVLGVLSGIGIVVIPRVIDEVRELAQRLPVYAADIERAYERLLANLRFYGYMIPAGEIQKWFVEQLPQVGQIFADQTTAALKGLTSGLAALLNLLIIPFVTFYVLKDYERIKQALQDILPRHHVDMMVGILKGVDIVLGQYVRGQILVCGFIAALTSLGLGLLGIRYAVLLGLMAGISNLVPYVGLAVSLGVASLVALLDADPFANLLKVIGVFVVVQGIEGNFLSPRVVGQRVGLHPAWVMFALVVSAHFWGFVGMVIAIPVAAVLNILIKILAGMYYSSRYYGNSVD
jgi:predicted PurR-regulated permease PerM